MSYEELKEKFNDFFSLEEKNIAILHLRISEFNLKKYKSCRDEFVQYIVFVLLKVKEINKRKNNFSDFNVYMNGANSKNFSPVYLKQIINILDPMLEDEIIQNVYLHDLNNFMRKVFVIIKPFFHKETVGKFCIVN